SGLVEDPASAGLAGQFEENSAPELVDTTGAEAPVGRISNRFDVEAGCRIVLTEFEEELKSLAFDGLLHLGHVLVHRDVHRSAPSPSPFPSSLLLSEVDAEELSTPRSASIDVTVSTVADTRIHPLSSSSAVSSSSGSNSTAILCSGHAKSREMPSSVSKPHSGTLITPEAARAFANSASSGSISGWERSSTHSADSGTPPSVTCTMSTPPLTPALTRSVGSGC